MLHGTSNTVQLHKSSSSSNVVMSPAFNPGTGNNRTVNGFFNRYAIVPTSLDNAQIWATVVLPGIGTCPISRKHRNTVSMDQVIQACLCKQLKIGTGRYTTSTTHIYHQPTDCTYRVQPNAEKQRVIEWNCGNH